MRRIITFLLSCLVIFELASCASMKLTSKEPVLLIIVQNRSKGLIAQSATLTLSGIEKPLRFNVRTPYVLIKMPNIGEFTTREYATIRRKIVIAEKFSSDNDSVTIFPLKIVCYTSSTSKMEEVTQNDIDELQIFIEEKDPFRGLPLKLPDLN